MSRRYRSNALTAWNPNFWARESLAILKENMVITRLVNRDFQPYVAQMGDVVNTRRPSEATPTRKGLNDQITVQDVTATNVQIELNQHVVSSFVIRDGEMSKGLENLIKVYIQPHALGMARYVDKMLLGQYPQFIHNSEGSLLGLSASNGKDYVVATRRRMNTNKAYEVGRHLILNTDSESTLLTIPEFTEAHKIGDNGTALRTASLGEKFQFQMWMCQNMASVNSGNTIRTGAVNLAAGYGVGTTTLVVDGFTGSTTNGSWLDIDGLPYQVVSTTETSSNTTGITISSGLRRAVADNAVIKSYTAAAVNLSGGYAAGYDGEIVIDGTTPAPNVGQFVTFGTSTTSARYTITKVTSNTGITLDRPLEAAIADDAAVNFGPAGRYNLAFHKDAITLAIRPLELPSPETGVRGSVMNMDGFSMRIIMAYEPRYQQHLVTMDFLCGVKVLDTNLGAVLCG